MNKIHRLAKPVYLKANSNKEFLLLHGYTGSPTDFNTLPSYLHKKLKSNVRVILLKGHGTTEKALKDIKLDEILYQIEHEIQRDLKKRRKIIVGGVSFGAQVALYLAAKYPVMGVFHVSLPYRFRFPFNIKGFWLIAYVKRFWKKRIPKYEKELRKNSFYYKKIDVYGLKFAKQMNKKISEILNNIHAPCLSIYPTCDRVGTIQSIYLVENQIRSRIKKRYIADFNGHNPFYSKHSRYVNKIIGDFFEKHVLSQSKLK
jgi:esterase/lipase